MLLVYFPYMIDFFRVFYAGKVANFARNFFRIFPSWDSPEGMESSSFRGPASQEVFIKFDFGVANILA